VEILELMLERRGLILCAYEVGERLEGGWVCRGLVGLAWWLVEWYLFLTTGKSGLLLSTLASIS